MQRSLGIIAILRLLLFLAAHSTSSRSIRSVINSPGGRVTAGLSGFAASAATVILVGGAKGKLVQIYAEQTGQAQEKIDSVLEANGRAPAA